MNWTQGTYSGSVWAFSDYAYHLQLDPDVAAQSAEQTYVSELETTAVAYAENLLGTSLLNRTITATFFADDAALGMLDYPYMQSAYKLRLPHGPVVSLTSVTDANGAITGCSTEGYGVGDYLTVPTIWTPPLTVEYVAGYGTDPSDIPMDIRQSIRAHVRFLYENRGESAQAAPEWLAAFYRGRARQVGVG